MAMSFPGLCIPSVLGNVVKAECEAPAGPNLQATFVLLLPGTTLKELKNRPRALSTDASLDTNLGRNNGF